MSRIARIAAVLSLLLAPLEAGASLTVVPALTVHNKCNTDIIIAVRYKDSHGTWRTTSFISIPRLERRERVVSSNNSIFYYYAQNLSETRPIRWSGEYGRMVDGKTYPMKKKQLTFDGNRNRFYLGLTCNR